MTEADPAHLGEQETQRPERIAGLYRALWKYATGKRGTFIVSTTLLVLSQVVKLGVPWLAARARGRSGAPPRLWSPAPAAPPEN